MKVYELENIIKKNGAIFTSVQIEKMMKKLEYVKYHDEMLSAVITETNHLNFANRLQEIADRIKADFKNRNCQICGISDARMISVFNCEHKTRQINKQNEKHIFAYPDYAIPCPACNKTAGEEAVKRTFQKSLFKGLGPYYIAYLEYNDRLDPLMYILKTCIDKSELDDLIAYSQETIYKKPAENDKIPVDFSSMIQKLSKESSIDKKCEKTTLNYLMELKEKYNG